VSLTRYLAETTSFTHCSQCVLLILERRSPPARPPARDLMVDEDERAIVTGQLFVAQLHHQTRCAVPTRVSPTPNSVVQQRCARTLEHEAGRDAHAGRLAGRALLPAGHDVEDTLGCAQKALFGCRAAAQ
jgi:hypothetical protein